MGRKPLLSRCSRYDTAAAARPCGLAHSPLNREPTRCSAKHAHFVQKATAPTNATLWPHCLLRTGSRFPPYCLPRLLPGLGEVARHPAGCQEPRQDSHSRILLARLAR